jgi:peptide-methionine (S)-S-oxide reductase
MPGYAGGHVENPSYEAVSSGTTGHAEAIQIKFDPEKISFLKLLEVFFKTHDPSQVGGQGHDTGPQYRSVIFYHSDKQQEETEKLIMKIDKARIYTEPVVTEVVPYKNFYVAEDYHLNYYLKNKDALYCQVVINPKIKKLEELFGELLKKY